METEIDDNELLSKLLFGLDGEEFPLSSPKRTKPSGPYSKQSVESDISHRPQYPSEISGSSSYEEEFQNYSSVLSEDGDGSHESSADRVSFYLILK